MLARGDPASRGAFGARAGRREGGGQGDAKAEARGHFDAGLALFKAEKYEAAALELEASVKLYPTKGGLFNLANVYKVLSRYDEALAAMDWLDREHGRDLDAEMRAAVERMRTEIGTLAAFLEVAVSPPGALVSVDGRPIGKSPISRPLRVDPGEHTVRASLDGYAATESRISVISRETARVGLTLDPEPAPPGAVAAPPAASPGAKEEPAAQVGEGGGDGRDGGKLPAGWFWAGLGATAAFGGVTLGMELAVRANRDGLTSEAERDKYERMQRAGISFLCLTGAAAVTTAVLAAFTDFRREGDAPLTVGVAPGGVTLGGSF